MSGTQSQSESTAETEPQAAPATNPLRKSLGWIAKHDPRIRLGHEGMMLESTQRGLRIREVAARNEMTGNRGNLDGWPGEEGDDKVGVNIGDHIHYHLQQQQEPQSVAQQPATPIEPVTQVAQPEIASAGSSLLSKALPWVVAAGLGVGGYMLGNKPATEQPPQQTQPQTQPAQPQPQQTDKWYNDKYGIRLEHYVPEPTP